MIYACCFTRLLGSSATKTLFAFVALLFVDSTAFAVVTEETVDPAYLEAHPKQFTVEMTRTEAKDKRLLRFKITRNLTQSRYIVAHCSLGEGAVGAGEAHFATFADASPVTVYFIVPEERLASATCTFAERGFKQDDSGHPVALPGGTDYRIKLVKFASEDSGDQPTND